MLRPLTAAICVIGMLTLAPASAFAAGAQGAYLRDDHNALGDIVKADAALAHHHLATARADTGDAETILLNAQQKGLSKDQTALSALERAHDDLNNRNEHQAAAELQVARNLLSAKG